MAKGAPIAIEVTVRLDGRFVETVMLHQPRVTIGRDPKADVTLDSSHVSRLHAELLIDDESVRIKDAGSTNGVRVGGERVQQASVQPGDVMEVCDFQLTYRATTVSRVAEAEPTPVGGGWDEYLTEPDPDEEARSAEHTALRQVPGQDVGLLRPYHRDPNIPDGSVLNELAYQRHTIEITSADLDGLEEDDQRPDVPPLIVRLHEEANSLLYGDNYAALAVEVIVVVGGVVDQMALLMPGEDFWWGGQPGGIEGLVVVPTVQRFPMVTHLRDGMFRVQIPYDTTWKMFHRGDTSVEMFRVGHLVGCDNEAGEQIEIRYGPFSAYVRSVRAPPRQPASERWRTTRPEPMIFAALLASVLLHAGAAALPAPNLLPTLRMPAPPPVNYATLEFATPEIDVEIQPEVPPEPEVEPPPPDPEADPSPEPGLVIPVLVEPEAPPAPTPLRIRKRRPVEITPKPEPEPEENKNVSVADFKVAGLISHLPTTRPDVRRSRPVDELLREGRIPKGGIVHKSGMDMLVTPSGTIGGTVIRRVVNRNARSIGLCYQQALRTNPTLQGRIDLQWIVDKRGRAGGVRSVYDGAGSPMLVRCLRSVVKNWLFPAPSGGAAEVTYPFTFTNPRL